MFDAFCTSGSSPTEDSLQNENRVCCANPDDTTFLNARLLQPIDCHKHLNFIERRMQQRLFEPVTRPHHVVGDAACRAFMAHNPVPPPSYPSGEQDYVDISLRQWAKSAKTNTTDQNHLSEYRYNRHVHCPGTILPAAQTCPDNWFRPPRAYPPNLVPLTFRSPADTDAEIEEGRNRVRELALEYELDWRTQAEREEFLRQTKKARRSPQGLLPRKGVLRFKDLDDIRGTLNHEPVPILKTGKLPQPSDELIDYWNTQLERLGLPEEVDFYLRSFTNGSDGRERSPEDEVVREHQFDHVNFDGMRETTGVRPHDHHSRSKWQKLWQARFNGFNKAWKDVTEEDTRQVTEDPDFPLEVARMQVMFDNKPLKELAQQLGVTPNTLTKSLSRNRVLASHAEQIFAGIDCSKANGRLSIVIHLNGRNELKVLGANSGPSSMLLSALEKEQAKTLKAARKSVRRRARQNKWDAARQQAAEEAAMRRIREAYAPFEAIVCGLSG